MEIYMMVYRPGVSLTDDGSQGCAESQIVNILSNHNKWPSLEQQQPWWRHIKAPFYERSGVTIVSIVSMTSHQHLTQTDLYTSHNLPFVLSEPRQIKLGSGRELSGPLLAAGLLLLQHQWRSYEAQFSYFQHHAWKDVHITTILTETWFYPHLIL